MEVEDSTFKNMRSPSFSATQSHKAVHFPIPPFAAKRVQRASSVASMGDVKAARGEGRNARSAAKLPYSVGVQTYSNSGHALSRLRQDLSHKFIYINTCQYKNGYKSVQFAYAFMP